MSNSISENRITVFAVVTSKYIPHVNGCPALDIRSEQDFYIVYIKSTVSHGIRR